MATAAPAASDDAALEIDRKLQRKTRTSRQGEGLPAPTWLGAFRVKHQGYCQARCGETTTRAATWIYYGRILVLGLCDHCAEIAASASEGRVCISDDVLARNRPELDARAATREPVARAGDKHERVPVAKPAEHTFAYRTPLW